MIKLFRATFLSLIFVAVMVSFSGTALAKDSPFPPHQISGDDDSKIKIVVVPDGFKTEELPLYRKNVNRIVLQGILKSEAFNKYAADFRLYSIETPSQSSGLFNNFFGSLKSNSITYVDFKDRGSPAKFIKNYVPDCDGVIVLLNYGTMAGVTHFKILPTSQISTGKDQTPVAIHEFGHILGLPDEYAYADNTNQKEVAGISPNLKCLMKDCWKDQILCSSCEAKAIKGIEKLKNNSDDLKPLVTLEPTEATKNLYGIKVSRRVSGEDQTIDTSPTSALAPAKISAQTRAKTRAQAKTKAKTNTKDDKTESEEPTESDAPNESTEPNESDDPNESTEPTEFANPTAVTESDEVAIEQPALTGESLTTLSPADEEQVPSNASPISRFFKQIMSSLLHNFLK